MGRRFVFAACSIAAVLGSGLVGSGVALANPRATVPLGTFVCADGRTLVPYGVPAPGFLNQSPVGIIDGKGVVARWFVSHDMGEVTIVSGDHAGEVIPYDDTFAGAPGEHRRSPSPDLSRLIGCRSAAPDGYEDSGTIDADLAAYLNLDASYVGASFTVSGQFDLTIYLMPLQLAHR